MPGIGVGVGAPFNPNITVLGKAIRMLFTQDAPIAKTPGLTFSRSTTATVLDYQGNMLTAKPSELRIQNARRVENLSNSTFDDWIDNGAPIVSTPANPINGVGAVRRYRETGSQGSGVYKSLPSVENNQFFIQLLLRVNAGSTNGVYFGTDSYSGSGGAIFDTVNRSVGVYSGSPLDYGLDDLGGGVYRAWVKVITRPGQATTPVVAYQQVGSDVDVAVHVEVARPGQTKPSEFVSNGENITDGREVVANSGLDVNADNWLATNGTITHSNGVLQFTNSNDGNFNRVSHPISLLPNQVYRVRARFKPDEANSVSLAARLRVVINNNANPFGNKIATSDTEWTELDETFIAPSDTGGITEVRLEVASASVWGASGDSGYLDYFSVQRVVHHGFGVDGVKYLDNRPPENLLSNTSTDLIGIRVNDAAKIGPADAQGWCTVTKETTNTSEAAVTTYIDCDGVASARIELLAGTSDVVWVGLRQITPGAWVTNGVQAEIESGPGTLQTSASSLRAISALSPTEPTVLVIKTPIAVGSQAGLFIYPGGAPSNTIGDSIRARNLCLTSRYEFPEAGDVFGGPNLPITKDRAALIEGRASTNYAEFSEDFSDAGWFKTSLNGGTAPIVVGDKITLNAPSGANDDRSTVSSTFPLGVQGDDYCGSAWVKAARPEDVGKVVLMRHVGRAQYLNIVLSAEWTRWHSIETNSVGTLFWEFSLRPATSGIEGEVQFHAKVQLENAGYPSSYIKTTSAAVTRASDVMKIKHDIAGYDTKGQALIEYASTQRPAESGVFAVLGTVGNINDILYHGTSGNTVTYDGVNIANAATPSHFDGVNRTLSSRWSSSTGLMSVTIDGQTAEGTFKGTTRNDPNPLDVMRNANGLVKRVEVKSR